MQFQVYEVIRLVSCPDTCCQRCVPTYAEAAVAAAPAAGAARDRTAAARRGTGGTWTGEGADGETGADPRLETGREHVLNH